MQTVKCAVWVRVCFLCVCLCSHTTNQPTTSVPSLPGNSQRVFQLLLHWTSQLNFKHCPSCQTAWQEIIFTVRPDKQTQSASVQMISGSLSACRTNAAFSQPLKAWGPPSDAALYCLMQVNQSSWLTCYKHLCDDKLSSWKLLFLIHHICGINFTHEGRRTCAILIWKSNAVATLWSVCLMCDKSTCSLTRNMLTNVSLWFLVGIRKYIFILVLCLCC